MASSITVTCFAQYIDRMENRLPHMSAVLLSLQGLGFAKELAMHEHTWGLQMIMHQIYKQIHQLSKQAHGKRGTADGERQPARA